MASRSGESEWEHAAATRSAIFRSGSPAPLLFLFAGTFSAILLTGRLDQAALGVLLVVAGGVLTTIRPGVQLVWHVWALAGLFLVSTALSLLPLEWSTVPQWRQVLQAADEIPLGNSITPVPNETLWWWGLLVSTVGVALFALTRPLRSRDQLVLANLVLLCTVVYAALAIVSELSGWKFAFDGETTFGFFKNRNHTATFLVVGAVTAMGVFGLPRELGHRHSRWFAGAAFLLCAIALVSFSMSRAGVIFLGVGATIWVLGTQFQKRAQSRSLLVGAMLLGVVFLFIIAGGDARQRVLAMLNLEEGVRQKSATSKAAEPADFRLLIFKDTWRIIHDHPLTGTGLGTYELIYPQYQQASLRNARAKHPESDWLMLASEAGLPAVASLVALICVASVSLRALRNHPYWSLRWGIFSAATAAALHGMIDVPAHRVPLGWWIVLLGAASLRLQGPSRAPHWSQRVAFVVAGLTALALGAGLLNAAWFKGNSPAPFRAEQTQRLVSETAATGDTEEAIEIAEDGIDRNPLSFGLYHQLGTILLEEGELEDVERLFAAERLIQPTWPEIPYRQGKTWQPVDPEQTAALWKEALRRQLAIDLAAHESGAPAFLVRLLRESNKAPEIQLALLPINEPKEVTWKWLESATSEVFESGIERLNADRRFLDSLDPKEQLRFVHLWARRGEPENVRRFLEESAGWGEYDWLLELRAAIDRRDYEAATKLLCRVFEVSLELPKAPLNQPVGSGPIDRFLHQWALGKEISAREALQEASASPTVSSTTRKWQACVAANDGKWKDAFEFLRAYLTAEKLLP